MRTINLAWWNLENLFDTDDDPISNDFEYTVENGWTEEAFQAKIQNLAAVLKKLHNGTGIDLLAVCEIEKESLLERLAASAGLVNLKVAKDPTGTRDLRGIDVAVAYNHSKIRMIKVESHVVSLRYATRDILEARFEIIETGEPFTVIAVHSPSRRQGKYASEPSRIAVAENVAFLVQWHLKYEAGDYENMRNANLLQEIKNKWEHKIIIVGDFNDEPFDRSIAENLNATGDLDRVIGKTNDISKFDKETSDYRERGIFLYNASYKFISTDGVGTFFMDGTMDGEKFSRRYQVLDQLIVSRGMVNGKSGLQLDRDSVQIFADKTMNATPTLRPKPFDRTTKKGYSDHFPLTAVLRWE